MTPVFFVLTGGLSILSLMKAEVSKSHMVLIFEEMQRNYLGYAAMFACISAGFLCLRNISKNDVGPEYWAASFICNCMGFLFWAGIFSVSKRVYYIIGELFHISGFFLLVVGAYKFTGKKFRSWAMISTFIWFVFWLISVVLFNKYTSISLFSLKVLRAILVIFAGLTLLIDGKNKETIGINVAGISLIIWGVYIVVFIFINIDSYLYYGFLIGLHILAAFGMAAIIIDKIRIRAEKDETLIQNLEGILPICAYCKKIRDDNNQWHSIEEYIEDRSDAEFSHGICPECFSKYKPDK